jgi:hypothetical protein
MRSVKESNDDDNDCREMQPESWILNMAVTGSDLHPAESSSHLMSYFCNIICILTPISTSIFHVIFQGKTRAHHSSVLEIKIFQPRLFIGHSGRAV